jgi:hypothetical protein
MTKQSHIIEFEGRVDKLKGSIKQAKGLVDGLQNAATSFGNSFIESSKQSASSLGSVGQAAAAIHPAAMIAVVAADQLGGAFTKVKELGIDAIKGIGYAVAGTAAGIAALNSSLGDLDTGLRKMLQVKANERFAGLATRINSTTAGIIDFNKALTIAQRGVTAGFGEETIVTMGKYAAQLSVTSAKTLDVLQITKEFQKAAQTGTLGEEITAYDSAITRMLKGRLDKTNRLNNMRLIRNAINKRNLELQKETGGVLNTNLAKFKGVVAAIKDESTGVFDVLKGFGKAAVGILAPFGAGIAGFATSPLTGLVGTGLGALASGAIAAVAVRAIKAFTVGIEGEAGRLGKDSQKDIAERLNAMMSLVSIMFEAFTGGILGTTGKLGEVGKDASKALSKMGLNPKEIAKRLGQVREFGVAIAKFSDAFLKEIDFSRIIKKFRDAFSPEAAEKVDIKEMATKLGTAMGKATGVISEMVSGFLGETTNFLLTTDWDTVSRNIKIGLTVTKTLFDTLASMIDMLKYFSMAHQIVGFKESMTMFSDLFKETTKPIQEAVERTVEKQVIKTEVITPTPEKPEPPKQVDVTDAQVQQKTLELLDNLNNYLRHQTVNR